MRPELLVKLRFRGPGLGRKRGRLDRRSSRRPVLPSELLEEIPPAALWEALCEAVSPRGLRAAGRC